MQKQTCILSPDLIEYALNFHRGANGGGETQTSEARNPSNRLSRGKEETLPASHSMFSAIVHGENNHTDGYRILVFFLHLGFSFCFYPRLSKQKKNCHRSLIRWNNNTALLRSFCMMCLNFLKNFLIPKESPTPDPNPQCFSVSFDRKMRLYHCKQLLIVDKENHWEASQKTLQKS